MLSEALHMGLRVRVKDGAPYRAGRVGTVTEVYGDRSYLAAEVKFDDLRTVLYWHYQIDPIKQQDQ
jgi:hypothetical protein